VISVLDTQHPTYGGDDCCEVEFRGYLDLHSKEEPSKEAYLPHNSSGRRAYCYRRKYCLSE
jgi:hypothetical protein